MKYKANITLIYGESRNCWWFQGNHILNTLKKNIEYTQQSYWGSKNICIGDWRVLSKMGKKDESKGSKREKVKV